MGGHADIVPEKLRVVNLFVFVHNGTNFPFSEACSIIASAIKSGGKREDALLTLVAGGDCPILLRPGRLALPIVCVLGNSILRIHVILG